MKHLQKNPGDSGLSTEMESMSQVVENTTAAARGLIEGGAAKLADTMSLIAEKKSDEVVFPLEWYSSSN